MLRTSTAREFVYKSRLASLVSRLLDMYSWFCMGSVPLDVYGHWLNGVRYLDLLLTSLVVRGKKECCSFGRKDTGKLPVQVILTTSSRGILAKTNAEYRS